MAWLDSFTAIILLAVLLPAAYGLGWLFLSRFHLQEENSLAAGLAALGLGLGLTAYGVLFLGLAGLLEGGILAAWLVVVVLLGALEWRKVKHGMRQIWRSLGSFNRLGGIEKILAGLVGILLLLSFVQALTPPWDYDSLLYHLDVPRQFLEQGQIIDTPDDWLTYFPLTIEMLFLFGLGLGNDIFARLIEFTFSVLLLVGTYALGRRYLRPWGAWLAVAILAGTPIFPIWASWAYVDMGWAFFILISICAVMIWGENQQHSWLVVAAVMLGFGLGSKYMALGQAASVGIWVLWLSRKQGWRRLLGNAALFGGIALLVCSPWYLKNLLWRGNPIYPLLFSAPPGWSPTRREVWMSFVQGFGTGTSAWDALLSPANLYLRHELYATSFGSIEFPSLLFPLVIFYPFTRKRSEMTGFLVISMIQFVAWTVGSQVNRYLLPIYPLLSLLVSHVLIDFESRERWKRLGFVLSRGLALSMLGVTLAYSLLYFIEIKPLPVITGQEARQDFLRRIIGDYAALEYIQSRLPADSRVLMMWDGRGYYCDQRCIPDTDHSQWTDLVVQNGQVDLMAAALLQQGITHLLLGVEDADYILQHDPLGVHRSALDFFANQFRTACTREIFRNQWTVLYELTCVH
jgi:4-amino-4-deoxy-L-arabinose transferase-like glycosyltransferase